ncbi:MAG: TrkA C-terminal domain-containing protein, partial [Saprospiraceae bacterium]
MKNIMLNTIIELLSPTQNPGITESLIIVMFTIALGIFLGNLKFKRISFGLSAVMFTGLFLGHYGYTIDIKTLDFLRDFGLILFVYGIGIQVGLHFFSSLRKYGLKYNMLAVFTALMGGIVALIIFLVTGQSMENVVGMMSGAVTNTPGLGAATSVLSEFKSKFPDRTFIDPAIAYAITYPFGVMGVIGSIILAKYIFRIDVEKESEEFYMETKSQEKFPTVMKARITKEDAVGMKISDVVEKFGKDKIIFSRIKHSGSSQVLSPSAETILEYLDVVVIVGLKDDLDKVTEFLGRVSSDKLVERETEIQAKTLIVTKRKAVHKTLSDLDLFNRYDLKVTRVFRGGKSLLAHPNLALFFGDKIAVVGNKWSIQQAEKILGNKEEKLLEPDFVSLFGGLILG